MKIKILWLKNKQNKHTKQLVYKCASAYLYFPQMLHLQGHVHAMDPEMQPSLPDNNSEVSLFLFTTLR